MSKKSLVSVSVDIDHVLELADKVNKVVDDLEKEGKAILFFHEFKGRNRCADGTFKEVIGYNIIYKNQTNKGDD